jgi:hypothetical protein
MPVQERITMCKDVYRGAEMREIAASDLIDGAQFSLDGFEFHIHGVKDDWVYYVKTHGEAYALYKMPIADFVNAYNEELKQGG